MLTLTFLPTVCVLLASTVFQAYWPLIDAPLPESAGSWLARTLKNRGLGVTVAALDGSGHNTRNFYHPPSRTIVLAEDVHGEHTARAYATAAHELGHAIFHSSGQWIGRAALHARRRASHCFHLSVGLLAGCALVGGVWMRVAAMTVMAVAIALQALVVVDEAIANVIARRVLTGELQGDHMRIVRGHQRRALATYGAQLLAYVTAMIATPFLFAHIGTDGVLAPAAPLVGSARTAATVISVACVLAALVAARAIVRPKAGLPGSLAVLLAMLWAPLLTVLVCAQPALPAWTVVLATAPTWGFLAVPFSLVLNHLAHFLGRELDIQPLPFRVPGAFAIGRVSVKQLAREEDQEPDGVLARMLTYSTALWMLPLALVWLFGV